MEDIGEGEGDIDTTVDIDHGVDVSDNVYAVANENEFKNVPGGSGEVDHHTGIAMISDSAALVAPVDVGDASTSDDLDLGKISGNDHGDTALLPEKKKRKGTKSKKKQKQSKRSKKPPDAPKRFKSSFIFFSMEKHKEIKEKLAKEIENKTVNITSLVSEAWRTLDPLERHKFEEMARQDKERYDIEKSNYVPPPGMFLDSKRRRDPNAPKRPMSAYLSFANKIRGKIKAENPGRTNGEISKILSSMWKGMPAKERKEYKNIEQALWAAYRKKMVEWKKINDGRKKEKKTAKGEDLKKKLEQSAIGSIEFPGHAVVDNDAGVDEQLLCLGGVPGIDTNPNTDEMMAASALRGVRGGPQPHVGAGMGDPSNNNNNSSSNNNINGGYGTFLGVNATNGMNPMLAGAQVPGQGAFGQIDMSGFPYNQYNYHLGGNTHAMIMAQLRGAPHQQYPGFLPMDQQANLSQLASLAGVQNDATQQQQGQNHMHGSMDQASVSVSENGMDMGMGNGVRNQTMGNNALNDGSSGSIAF